MLNIMDLATRVCQPIYPFRYWCLPDKKPEKLAPDKETENPSVPDDKPEEPEPLDEGIAPTPEESEPPDEGIAPYPEKCDDPVDGFDDMCY